MFNCSFEASHTMRFNSIVETGQHAKLVYPSPQPVMSQPYPVPIPLPQPKSRPLTDSRGIPDTLSLFFFSLCAS